MSSPDVTREYGENDLPEDAETLAVKAEAIRDGLREDGAILSVEEIIEHLEDGGHVVPFTYGN